MNRNSVNVTKTKKLISGVGNNSKHNRKTFHNISDSSSISSNRNSSAHSEEDVRVSGVYLRPQVENNAQYDEQEEQVTKKLQAKVKELRHKLRVLEESVDSKDYSLGTIAREKDRAIGEIRRLERSNKLLRQQLNDERNHYMEEKEKFCEEMTKYKKKLQDVKSDTDGGKKTPSLSRQPLINQSLRWQLSKEKGDFADLKTTRDNLKKSNSQKELGVKDSKLIHPAFTDSQIRKPSSIDSFHLYEGDDVSLQMAALRTENAKLRSIICERDERNYELCLRFLRMKHYKNDIKDRFQDLENEYLQVIANLMDKIDEARQEFNFIIDQKFKRPLHSTNAMYLQMVQKNSRMAFENASLRLENQCLKKELNKYANSSTECERKTEVEPTTETEPKLEMAKNKSDTKLKRIKKNVNFKEIRTIYERSLTLKTSDTDSNYMSKTSTTVPSNGSLVDPKSNESIAVGEQSNKQLAILQPTLQANALPDEILQKIFKRIDTSSCQTVDSGRSKEQSKSEVKLKDSLTERVDSSESKLKSSEKQEKSSQEDSSTKKGQTEPIVIEHKSPPKLTDSSSPCDSKESVKFHLKETCDADFPTNRAEKPKKDNYFTLRRQTKQEQSWAFKNRLKSRVRCDWNLDRDSEGSSSLDFPLRRFPFTAGRNRFGRQEKTTQVVTLREAPPMTRPHQLQDNCGLQEKLEFSDLELPLCTSLSGVPDQTVVDTGKPNEDRGEATESDDDDLGDNIAICAAMKNVTPAIGSRSRSSNKVNLQEELMEATMAESLRRKERKLSSIQLRTASKTYRQEKENSDSEKNIQSDLLTDQIVSLNQETDLMNKKPEASKRFSQRLFSTSPEQLKNILTESQFGPIRVAPIIVGHASTEMASTFKCGDTNSEIFLQLVLPSTSPRHSALFSDNEVTEKATIEKETSTCEISPVRPSKTSNQMEGCASDIRIPISSLATSNSTMEMVDSAVIERSNIMMRTLSAPGLLESNWLDPYTVCETRDCSTNT